MAIICARAQWRRIRRSCARSRTRRGSGVAVLGICNGFQVLTETGLLPGALMRNASLKFICRDVHVRAERARHALCRRLCRRDRAINIPIAHKDGNYFADEDTLDRLEGEGRIAFRYCDEDGAITEAANPNGSRRNIAGLYDESGRVLGLMPHPERAADAASGRHGRAPALSHR